MTHATPFEARSHAPLVDQPDAFGRPELASPAPVMNASALAERMARKSAKLMRRHTLADVIRQYLAEAGEVLKRDPGRRATLRMWSDVLGHKLMDEITSDEVAEVLAMYAEQPVRRFAGRDAATGRPRYREFGQRAPSTVNRAKVVLSAMYAYAKSGGLLPMGFQTPTHDIRGKGFNAAELPDRALSAAQVETLLAHARTAPWPKMYLLVLMAVTTGARRGELLQLRGRDLLLDADEPHAIVGLRRSERERAGTKNGAVKVMPLSEIVVKEIKRWGIPEEDELLFGSKYKPGQAFDPSASYKALVKRAGLNKNTRFHDLRHTAGTIFANEGKSESQIAALLGHKTLTMVPRYTRVQPHAKAMVFKSSALARLK